MSNYQNELEQFIYEKCYSHIWEEINERLSVSPSFLDLTYSRVKYPDSAFLEDMILEFTNNITIDGDILRFSAILSCSIEVAQHDDYHDHLSCEISQWLQVFCKVTITEKISSFSITDIRPYEKGLRRASETEITASKNIVPIIYKEDLDKEASAFLREYCPEAIDSVMPVPIEDIIENVMHLTLIQGRCLTDNLSIFGQICFSSGSVNTYDLFKYTRCATPVSRGTIIIDASTFLERNVGCVNNTLAHEAFHWYRHRLYAAIRDILHNEKLISCRCPKQMAYPSDDEDWTDEDRMEWQANKIAPRILMPLNNFKSKVNELYKKYDFEGSNDKTATIETIIDELASFYVVSKQSAKIRLLDIGHAEAALVYNYNDSLEESFSTLYEEDAFFQYVSNASFRSIIDTGMFRFIDGKFVIDCAEYINHNPDGTFTLTDYAETHLQECALQFTYQKVSVNKHPDLFAGILYHSNNGFVNLPNYDSENNHSVEKAARELKKKREEFDQQYELHASTTLSFSKRIIQFMKAKHWNKVIFEEKTGLNEMTYSRICNDNLNHPDLRTVVSICSGLGLDITLTNELLTLAGKAFGNSLDDQAYSFVITGFQGKDLEEKNAFLESYSVKPLGSLQRK